MTTGNISGRQKYECPDPGLTMAQMVERIAKQYPNEPALDFYHKITTYKQLNERIERAAKAFYSYGIRRGDAVTICMPNTPQAIECFYALNRIGAVANMVHPLSAVNEITFYLTLSKSRMILAPDLFFEKVEQAVENVIDRREKETGQNKESCNRSVRKEIGREPVILVARMQDELPGPLAAAYCLTKGRPFLHFPKQSRGKAKSLRYPEFLKNAKGYISLPPQIYDPQHTSVILYSGGTSGEPKGICLSDLNFNALSLEACRAIGGNLKPGYKMLSCMPMFHGFGLGINIHTMLVHGVSCCLMPNFNIKDYGEMLLKKKPNYIAGVPTIFEALLHVERLEGKNLSFLKGIFCGGDVLSVELKKKVDAFLREHGAAVQIREGYGLTECVTASCLTPENEWREGSIGLPFPDIDYAIVTPGTDEVVPYGEDGEIILTGPTVMLRYLDNEEETAKTLRRLADGRIWLYTGDLGSMDEDGFIYFKQRIKRMIITNGYNVYPGQIENVIDGCEEVSYSCVVGVKDERKMKRVVAYVVLRDGVQESEECREHIYERLRDYVAAYAIPTEIIFRKELPKTLVGKVAYRLLE